MPALALSGLFLFILAEVALLVWVSTQIGWWTLVALMISTVLGAYLLQHPRAAVRTWIPPIFVLPLPAWIFLIYWFVLQVLGGLPGLAAGPGDATGGTAFWAHVGGFVAGALLIRRFEHPPRVLAQERLRLRSSRGR